MRCITPGVPRIGGRFGAGNDGYYQIMQARGHVIFFMRRSTTLEFFPLDGRPHLPPEIRSWNGDSQGRWRGRRWWWIQQTFRPRAVSWRAENLHLIERFTRVAADVINYEVTIDDTTTWTKPWTVLVRLKQTKDKLYEFACHEGNLPMMGTLAGARAQEK